MIEDTKKAETNEGFRKTMSKMYAMLMGPTEDQLSKEHVQGFSIAKIGTPEVMLSSSLMGFAKWWPLIIPGMQAKIISILPKIIENKQVVSVMRDVVGVVPKHGGTICDGGPCGGAPCL